MTKPSLRVDPEIEIDGVVEAAVGEFTVWFVHASGLDGWGTMVAFAEGDRMLTRRCVQPDAEGRGFTAEELEIYNRWEGRRCSAHLPGAEFWAEWHRITDPYLYPKKKGRIRVDMPLGPDTPPEIVADWLKDHEMYEIADVVRLMRPSRTVKFEIMQELVTEFRDSQACVTDAVPNVAALHNWCLDKMKEESK